MKRTIVTTFAVLAFAAASANAEMTKETTTSTTYSGTVSSVVPSSSTIVVKSETAEPNKYTYTEKTAWVDSNGNTVTREAVQNQPVTIHYEKQGDQTVVTKVVTQKTVSAPAPAPAPMIEKKTTTTTTTE